MPPAPVPSIDMGRPTLAIAAALLALAGCAHPGTKPAAAASPSAPATFTVTGTVTLNPGDFTWNDDPPECAGKDGYDDLAAGAQVVVTDPAGATIGVGEIVGSSPLVVDETATNCFLNFAVSGVPAGKQFYGVEVSHRGRLQYTEEEARGDLQLSIG